VLTLFPSFGRGGFLPSTNAVDRPSEFLSSIRPADGLEAVLLLKRTGVHVASWVRESASLEVLTVMSATALGSVQTIVEAIGGESPQEVLIETEACRMLFTTVEPQTLLVLIGQKDARESTLRQEARRLITRVRSRGLRVGSRRGSASEPRPNGPEPMLIGSADARVSR